MWGSKEKEEILRASGYRYNFSRMIYFNTDAKKVFSSEWVDDNNETELNRVVLEDNEDKWQFYTSGDQPSEALKSEIIKEINRGKS